jgi:predicted lipid-binding transport protein (Tim44 family)
MSAAVAILDALRKKPVAEKKKEYSVAFFVANAAKSKSKPNSREEKEREDREEEREDREDREEDREEREERREAGPTVQITDKASLKLVNREDIFARIKAARGIITEAAPNPLTLTAAKLVSIVEEAPVPKLKGRKLQKIKLIPVSAAPALDKVVLQEVAEEVAAEEAPNDVVDVANLEPLKQKHGTRKKGDKEAKDTEKTKELAQVQSNKAPQPTKPIEPLVASEYYLNNREKFVEFINKLFQKNFRAEIMDESRVVSCEDRRSAEEFGLLTHQKIVKDYLNMYSPYRGLLLYHGLGSGKTCSSIAIAEGLKSNKRVFVMTPAFLRTNYMQELKKCGDDIYKRPRHWKFVDAVEKPELVPSLAETLDIPAEYVKKHNGAWLVDPEKPSNYGDLSPKEQGEVDAQLNEMIQAKYTFISYNGVRENRINELSLGYTVNPFDNSVVIIDEAHNFVSRIVNHIKKAPSDTEKGAKGAKAKAAKVLKPEDAPIALNLYRFLLDAVNVKIILLSGTPIINYPNEIGVLFNILRGYIKTWTLQLASSAQGITEARLQQLFKSVDIMDYMKYSATDKMLTVTRNPYGFVNVQKVLAKGAVKAQLDKLYNGVAFDMDEHGSVSDEDFIKLVTATLATEGIKATKSAANPVAHKALPDTFDGFEKYFIDADTADLKNMDVFKRRILGLTSYYRSAQEQLLPRYDVANDFEVVRVPMSNYQLSVYQQERLVEINKDREANKRKMLAPGRKPRAEGATGAVGKKPMTMKELYSEPSSSYRIFSRAACNFVFPREIGRPKPFGKGAAEGASAAEDMDEDIDEDIIDADNARAIAQNPEGALGVDEAAELQKKTTTEAYKQYEDRIQEVLDQLKRNEEEYFNPRALAIYSPKFLKLLQNLQDPKHEGLNLVYSQFRTLEGIGLLKMAMEANDYAQFRIKHNKASNQWVLDNRPEDAGKRRFALYTGSETAEEKEIVRCIFNSEWDQVPSNIRDELLRISSNNFYGEVINTLMISASGAEGINLRNVRYVHILEPYWHPVRIEQVVGRARRICSHQDLPPALRTVNVFLYLMVYSPAQLKPLTKEEKAAADQEEALLASSDPKTVVDVSNAALKFIRVSRELRESDTSTKTGQPITTDESLYEIAKTKEAINSNILRCVKETAIDCAIHAKAGSKETLKCFTFDNPENKFAYTPNIQDEVSTSEEPTKKSAAAKPKAKPAAAAAAATAEAVPLNKEMRKMKIKEIMHDGVKYGIDIENNDVYDYENLKIGNRVLVGKFVELKPGKFTIVTD